MSDTPQEEPVTDEDLDLMSGGAEENGEAGRFSEREIDEGAGKFSEREL